MTDLDITLFRGWKATGQYVWSPFVIKLEARLRFAGIKYKTDSGSPLKGPKGKIPYLECNDPANPTSKVQLGDSTLIIKQLGEWSILPDINAQVSQVAKTHDMALRALLEDKLYFYHMHERWTQNYHTMRDHVFAAMPYPVRVIVGVMVFRSAMATLQGQGTGRFSAEEIAAFRLSIWDGINNLLTESRANAESNSNGPFWVLGGKEPTEADATLFGFIASVMICTAGPDSRKMVEGFPAVLDYASRIHDTYFPDYEKWKA